MKDSIAQKSIWCLAEFLCLSEGKTNSSFSEAIARVLSSATTLALHQSTLDHHHGGGIMTIEILSSQGDSSSNR